LVRLRDDYKEFASRDAEIVAVSPDRPATFRLYWRAERIPFVGLPDPEHRVALAYRQEVHLFKLGRMPLATVLDRDGVIRYAHYGASMSDIPENHTLLGLIDRLREA
jgi:peroxiredoxin Q/BCP